MIAAVDDEVGDELLDALDVELDRVAWAAAESQVDACEALELIDAYRERVAEECGSA